MAKVWRYDDIVKRGDNLRMNGITRTVTLGSYIKERRKQLHMTQEDLAARLTELGESKGATRISQWENEHSQPPFEVINKLSIALDEPSPGKLLALGGYLESIKGNDIIALLYDKPDDTIRLIERIAKAIIEQRNGTD